MFRHLPLFQDIIGHALPMIGSYGQLDNTQQVVALIDEVRLCKNTKTHMSFIT